MRDIVRWAADINELEVQRYRHFAPRVRLLAERYIATGAMEWGDPILPSAICAIAHGRLWYRGHDALRLAETRAFEEAEAILWECQEVSFPGDHRQAGVRGPVSSRRGSTTSGQALLAMLSANG
jgi:hypothetical protein